MRLKLILVGLKALLGVDLPPDAAQEGNAFVPMILDQVTKGGTHSICIVWNEHGRARHFHRLGDDGQAAIHVPHQSQVGRAGAVSDISGQNQAIELIGLDQVI